MEPFVHGDIIDGNFFDGFFIFSECVHDDGDFISVGSDEYTWCGDIWELVVIAVFGVCVGATFDEDGLVCGCVDEIINE